MWLEDLKMKGLVTLVSALSVLFLANRACGAVKPGDELTPENAALVQDLSRPAYHSDKAA
jgi:hypothetical protein